MNSIAAHIDRRAVLAGGAALGAAALWPFGQALGAYPEHKVGVVVPTRAGGGADRLLRAIISVWSKHLKTDFEPGFFPGASGRVGYELFMNKREPDGYSVLFGNMGPEVLNWVVKPPTSFKFPGDYVYFMSVDADPSAVFISSKSKFRNIDDIVAESKKRTVTVATSRLAHPASLGILALGDHVKGRFNLVPLSGGRNTVAGVVTGEVDIGVLPVAAVLPRGGAVKVVALFDDTNVVAKQTANAPTANAHFGMKLPPLVSARAFALHKKAIDAHPDRYAVLKSSLKATYEDPAFKPAMAKAKVPLEVLKYGDEKSCENYVAYINEIGNRYKPLLTGKK